jgi:hypothetical protein
MTEWHDNYKLRHKICSKCKLELPISAFAKANGYYPRSECKECGKKQNKIRNELKKLHGQPPKDYNCPVCKREYNDIQYLGTKKNNWCLDHDHKTGKFRGWLCHDCNKALGFFKDDVSLMKSAIEYVEKND